MRGKNIRASFGTDPSGPDTRMDTVNTKGAGVTAAPFSGLSAPGGRRSSEIDWPISEYSKGL